MAVNEMPKTIAELFAELKAAKTKNERAKLLKENDSLALRGLLRMNFDSSLKLSLPEGTPSNYRPNPKPVGFGNTTLKTSAAGWYVFCEDSCPGLRQSKREQLFLNLLEELDSVEADILIKAKDKKLDIGVTRKLVEEVYPGLLKDVKKNEKIEEETKAKETTNESEPNNSV